jgi:hypothetical protein
VAVWALRGAVAGTALVGWSKGEGLP